MKKIVSALFLAFSAASWSQVNIGDYFGDLRARQIGPALMSGRISEIEAHPKNSSIVYVGAAGGGVWKSNDGGVRFTSIFDDYCQSIGCIKLDPSDPDNTVWVGTGEVWTRNSVSLGDGIYKTNDGGKNWTKMGLEKSERISSIQIDPKNSSIIYAGVLGGLWSDTQERGVFKSEDGGKTWNKIFYVNEKTGCADLIMDPNNASILYASFWEFRRTAYSFNSGGINSALYKSTDAGKTWKKIHNGFPAGKMGRIAVAVAPSNSNIVYAVVESEKAEQRGLYRSENGGEDWKFLNGDFALTVRPFYFSRIVVDPKNPDIILKAGLFGSISRDGGKTFKNLGAMHSDIHDFTFDPTNSEKIFVGTDGGLYRSLNTGTTLEKIENLPVSQYYHVSVDNQTPYNVYGGLQDNNSWFGPSASPGGIEARDWQLVGQGDGFRVYPHRTKPQIVYSEMQGADAIWRFDTKEQQLKIVKPFPVTGDPKLRFNWNAAITTSKHKADRLYAGSQFLHKSDDMGNTWVKISPDLTTNDPSKQNVESGGISADNSGAENHCTIFSIAESPLDENVIWVGTDDGNVQLTKDGGKIWTNVTSKFASLGLPVGTWCYHIEASSFKKEVAYAVFTGYTKGDFKPYVFKTEDYGQTWTSVVSAEIPTFVRNIQEDTKNPNLLYLGTEMGLYITIDGGKSWAKFKNNVPSVAIHYLEIAPQTNDLVIATHGRGIIIIDDLSPLQNFNADILNKNLTFFDSKPFTMSEKSSFGSTASEVEFVGENPTVNAVITYFLPKRHTFGKMTMEIIDANGKVISNLQPGKQKGINKVEWSFNQLAPKVAKGKTFSGGSMVAPRVAAGTYKVRITKGSEVFEKEIQTQYDPKSPFTLEERKLQQATVQQLFDFNQELAYLVYKVDIYLDAAEKAKKGLAKPNKNIDKFYQEMTAIKEGLVITKGDNYVGAGEPQLREKLGDVYSTVATYFGAPSSTQMENIAMLKADFHTAKTKVDVLLKSNWKAVETELIKLNQKPAEILDFDSFLKLD